MKEQLMLNDILWDGEHTCRVIALSKDMFLVRYDGGELDGKNARPMPLSNEWIVKSGVNEICEKNQIAIDFSRKRKLKISILDGNGKIIISYFYPMPQYVHELQHILRYFNDVEL